MPRYIDKDPHRGHTTSLFKLIHDTKDIANTQRDALDHLPFQFEERRSRSESAMMAGSCTLSVKFYIDCVSLYVKDFQIMLQIYCIEPCVQSLSLR
jgi:hypothetical protein